MVCGVPENKSQRVCGQANARMRAYRVILPQQGLTEITWAGLGSSLEFGGRGNTEDLGQLDETFVSESASVPVRSQGEYGAVALTWRWVQLTS